ncbi:MAG TPA: hypothetical protein VGO21_04775 [Candidatus Paceibacterota bacterium]|jgi:hypothetical protein|nr:hypothetical protein [Candidatus Paceibacterota bacterium]
MNKNISAVLILLIILVLGIVYFTNKKEAVAPVSTTPAVVTTPDSKEMCYFKETVGTESTDDAFTSINYDEGGKVHGIINTIPSEKDSLVGTYTGTVESNPGMVGYPTQLNIIYAAYGEGILSNQQELIAVGTNDIKTGTGEMYKDTDGVWKIKDMSKVVYDNAMPKVDCASVTPRFKADYSKTQ